MNVLNAVLLAIIVVCVTYQSVAKKIYNRISDTGAYTFSAGSAVVAMLFFIATSGGKFEFAGESLFYSALFATCYGVSILFTYKAISCGPLSLTALIVSYGTVLPAIYGFLFLNEPLKQQVIIGIVLLCVSLAFMNMENGAEKKVITLKWSVYVFLGTVGNGACSIVQKVQQIECAGKYKNEFMIIALLITSVALFAIAIVKEKKDFVLNLKNGAIWYVSCGAANGLVNYLVLVMALAVPASVMFPIISAGGIVASVIVSVAFYKEKLTKPQYVGVLLSIPAIVLLSI